MKKVLYAILALATLTLASCEKEPVGGTATEKMAGQWYVQVQGVDAKGAVLFEDEDLFGIGNFWLLTYNTSANSADSMWVSDVDGAFWEFQIKVGCDQANETFGVKAGADILNGITADITNGKILRQAATTPSGAKADSLVFEVLFSDDPYAGVYYDHLRVSGYRYTGLANDD